MKSTWIFFSVLFVSFSLFLISGCKDSKAPVKIGFANTLTGKASTWGHNSRNGAMLAVNEWNEAGGVNGRPIELIFRDDKADPVEALKIDQELIDLGVVAIIGHYLSTVSLQVVPLLNKNKMVMISTAASTTELAGVDDYFFRLVLSNKQMGSSLGYVCFETLKIARMTVIYDLSNPGYSTSFYKPLKEHFEKMGGRVVSATTFDRSNTFSAPDIARKIIESNADGVCLITNAIHGALICQHLRKKNSSIQIVASGWTFSDPNFISNGGNAVNGVVSVNEYNGESNNKSFIEYKRKFTHQFGDQSTHPDKVGYEAAQILLTALSENEDPERLKETILKIGQFSGVDGKIIIDNYGDSKCPKYMRKIQDGRILTVDVIDSNKL